MKSKQPRAYSKRTSKTTKQKLTDAERHKRFVEMAHEIHASEDAKDFDKAFDKITAPTKFSY